MLKQMKNHFIMPLIIFTVVALFFVVVNQSALAYTPQETKELLRRESDHVEVITIPSNSNFKSVGQYFQSFEPITDEQVVEIMKRNSG